MRGAHGHRKKVSECVRQLCPWTTRCLYKPDGGSQEMKCRYCAETCVLWTKSSCPPLKKNALEIHKAFMLPCPTERFAYTAGIPWNRKITSPTQNMESIVKLAHRNALPAMKQNKGTNPMVENWFQQPHPSPFTSVWTEAKIQVSATKKPSYHKNTGRRDSPLDGIRKPVVTAFTNISLLSPSRHHPNHRQGLRLPWLWFGHPLHQKRPKPPPQIRPSKMDIDIFFCEYWNQALKTWRIQNQGIVLSFPSLWKK